MRKLFVLMVLGVGCSQAPTPTPPVEQAPAGPTAPSFVPKPLDEIPATVSSLGFLKADGNDTMINGYYDYLRPDIVHVTPSLRVDNFRPFGKYDVHLYCNRGWPGGLNEQPLCDKAGHPAKSGARPICVYPEERKAPKGVDPMGASIAWTDNGQCAMEFKYGLITTPSQLKAATSVAMEAAGWMDRFVPPSPGPLEAAAKANHRLLVAARKIP